MKTIGSDRRWVRAMLGIVLGLAALWRAAAQMDDFDINVPVTFKGMVRSPVTIDPGTTAEFEGWIEASGLSVATVTGSTTTPNTTFATTEATALLTLGKEYTVAALYDGSYVEGRWQWANFSFSAPAGVEIYVEGLQTRFHKLMPQTFAKLVVRRKDGRSGGVASPLPPSVGAVVWQVPVGNCCDGTGGGVLEIRQTAFTSVFSPAGLNYVGDAWYDVTKVFSGGNIRQVMLPSRLVDIVTVANGYEIRFYQAGDFSTTLSGGVYPVNGGAVPVTKYYVENAVPANGKTLRITQTTGAETEAFELYYDSATKEWARTLFHNGAVQSVQVQKEVSSSPRVIELTQTNAAGVLAEKTRATYSVVGGRSLVTKVERDFGGNGFTTETAYYSDAGLPGSYLQKEWEKKSDGGWTRWEYYTSGAASRIGRIYRVFSPFKDTPATPEAATNATVGVVTTYTYTDNADNRLTGLVASMEQKIDDKLVAKTTYAYALATLPDGKTNVVKTINAFYGPGAGDYLTSIEKYFEPGMPGTQAFHRLKTHSVTEPTGRRTAYLHQRGNWSGGTFTAGTGNHSRVVKLIGTTANVGGSGRLVQYWDSAVAANRLDDLYLYANQSMVTVEVRGPAGTLIRAEERVLKPGTSGTTALLADFEVVSQTDATFDSLDHLLTRTTLRGTEYTASYTDGRLVEETDLAGVKSRHVWEDFGRLRQTVKVGVTNSYLTQASLTNTFDYDAAGRLLTNTVSSGSEQLVSRTAYDLAGEVTQTTDVNGVVRTRAWEKVGAETHFSLERVRVLNGTEAYTDGTNTYSEVVTLRHRDGRTKEVTGSALVPAYYAYEVPQAGLFKTTAFAGSASSPRNSQAFADMLGRATGAVVPKLGGGALTVTNYFTAGTGLLERTVESGKGDRYFHYDQFGRLQKEGVDADATAGLQNGSASDRIVEYDSRFVKVGSDWWLQSQSFGYPETNSTVRVLLARTRERLTGFPQTVNSGVTNFLAGESYSWGINPNPATLEADLTGRAGRGVVRRFPATVRVETYADSPDATADEVSRTVNGLTVATVTAAGASSTNVFDPLLRLVRVDQGTGNTDTNLGPAIISRQFEYYAGQTRLKKQSEQNTTGAWVTSLEQDFYADGSVKWTKNAEGRFTRVAYNARGQVSHRWGDGTTPERNAYDSYGALEYLFTYRGGSGWDSSTLPTAFGTATADTNRWVFDADTGLTLRKIDAAGKTNSWAYDAYNRAVGQTNARSISSAITLDPKTGEVTAKSYSDSTPSLGFTYNRLGLPTTVTDATGSRTLTYRTAKDYQFADETLNAAFYGTDLHLRTRFNASDSSSRAEGYTLGVATSATAAFSSTHLDVTYGFDTANGRLSSLQANTRNATKNHTFTLGYLGGSALLRQIDGSQSTVWKRAYEPFRAALKTMSVERSGTTYASYAFTRDDLARVTTETQSGELFKGYGTADNLTLTYTYNTRGELATADTKVNNNSVSLSERYFGATYDNAANRATENRYNASTSSSYRETYTPTALNQYSTKTVRSLVEVGGRDTVGGNITLTYSTAGTATATKPGGGQYWRAELNRSGASDSMQLASVLRNGTFFSYAPYAQRTGSESLAWDAAGNLTNTAMFSLTFDAEDRLIELRDKADPDIRKTIAYDYQGRRVEEKDYNSAGTLSQHRRFVWSGWALLAEVDVNVGTGAKTLNRTFVWGPDLSSTVHGAAGIGGLLLVDKSSTQQFLAGSSGRGDVTVLLDALATDTSTPANNLKAGVEYAPYGEILRSQGALADLPFRFQSKWSLGQNWAGAWPVDLIDFGRRAYAPALGRFISRDPLGEAGGANLYHYCGNDPVNRIDPFGLQDHPLPLPVLDAAGSVTHLPRMTVIGTRPAATVYGSLAIADFVQEMGERFANREAGENGGGAPGDGDAEDDKAPQCPEPEKAPRTPVQPQQIASQGSGDGGGVDWRDPDTIDRMWAGFGRYKATFDAYQTGARYLANGVALGLSAGLASGIGATEAAAGGAYRALGWTALNPGKTVLLGGAGETAVYYATGYDGPSPLALANVHVNTVPAGMIPQLAQLQQAQALRVTVLSELDVVVGMIKNGQVLKQVPYGTNPMLAPSHEMIAKELGVWLGTGTLADGVEAFTVFKEGGKIFIRGSGNFNDLVSDTAMEALKKCFQ